MEIADIKRNLNKRVLHNGFEYILTGSTIRRTGNRFWYEAELKDIQANSITRCNLENVDEKQESGV